MIDKNNLYSFKYIAIRLISKYFKDKIDKGGHPYIEHLMSVANKIRSLSIKNNLGDDDIYNKAYIVALLHDIIEDTPVTREYLYKEGIVDEEILDALESVTREAHEKYSEFVVRANKNKIGRLVKICDLEDNMDIRRLSRFDKYEQKRLRKYWYSWKYLQGDISEDEYIESFVEG